MTPDTPSGDFLERIRARLGDRYEISRELLGGGMSRVFVAREIALDRQVVIKFLPTEIAAEANRDRFRREIQMAARLAHPHIAPLFAAAEEGELLYYTMPFIAGESLKHSLEGGRHFGISETVEILRDVAGALAYAHRAGIVHRDIKPANILREGDHAVVTDFGVAKAVSQALGLDTRASAATASGMAIGTPAYMAPEQLAGDATADHRVDIYAFGLLGYELLTGKSPFRGTSPQALMAAQLTQPPPPLLDARPDVPPVLAALLTRCLEKDAARRPQSAESVIEVLRAVSVTSGAVGFTTAPQGLTRRRRVLAAAAVLTAAVIVTFIASRVTARSVAIAPAAADSAPPRPPVVVPPTPEVAAITRAERDSLRLLSEQIARKEQRLLGLLKDSISNAVHRSVADSIAQVRQLELATARVQDSLMKIATATKIVQTIPPPSRGAGPSEVYVNRSLIKESDMMNPRLRDSLSRLARSGAFTMQFGQRRPDRGPDRGPDHLAMRAANMGPPRRIAVSLYSGLRGPPILMAAVAIRDSILAKLRAQSRYLIIPTDSIAGALTRSRNTDSLRTWLNAEMWATININGEVGADSVNWAITLRDFTAHSSYGTRFISSKRFAVGNPSDPSVVPPLVEGVVQGLLQMDRSPRKDPPPPHPAEAKPPTEF